MLAILGCCAAAGAVIAIWVRVVDAAFLVPGPRDHEELDGDAAATTTSTGEDDGDAAHEGSDDSRS